MAVRRDVLNISSWLYYFWNVINVHNESLLMMRTIDMDAFFYCLFVRLLVLCICFDETFLFFSVFFFLFSALKYTATS